MGPILLCTIEIQTGFKDSGLGSVYWTMHYVVPLLDIFPQIRRPKLAFQHHGITFICVSIFSERKLHDIKIYTAMIIQN